MQVAHQKPTIAMEDLDKIDVRVGTIEAVEDVEGADELVKLIVDLGEPQKRIVLAGLKKERSNPKEIEGMQALFVVNLKPRRMRGLVSEAMLFDIGYADGVLPRLAVPEEPVPNGTRVG